MSRRYGTCSDAKIIPATRNRAARKASCSSVSRSIASNNVLNREVVRSSGHRELDNEVMSMIERAQPLPPFPASMPQVKLDLTVPIRFSLQ